MELRNNVYELEKILDDPRYEGFASEVFLAGAFPKDRSLHWQKIRLAPAWKPVKVTGRVRKFNDFPCLGLMPAFSERAVDALRDFLEPNGELLPLATPLGSYFVYNVTTIVDALDLRRSKIKWLRKPITALTIEHFEFVTKKIENCTIFHIPQKPSITYVTEPFAARARAHGLQGMDFKKMWPFPPGVDWRKAAKKQSDAQKAEGLPPGQTVKGNAVIIRLFLSGSTSKGTAEEKSAVNAMMDEIDDRLVNVDSNAPVVGNLEGFDFGVAGECRLFLSCPEADALIKALRPWLTKLKWPERFEVFKRYGNFADREAPEKLVKL